jgi:hypothetical protein
MDVGKLEATTLLICRDPLIASLQIGNEKSASHRPTSV